MNSLFRGSRDREYSNADHRTPNPEPLKLLVLGAHPDDAEFYAGGLVARYRQRGHAVRMVSLTNGSAGHHEKPRSQMSAIRRDEAAASARVTGAVYDIWEIPDGELMPTLDVRQRIVREIRAYRPDLVLTHRVYDYHPDHRAVGQAVQDACFLVRVPHVVPEVPALPKDPVVAYLPDLFTRPCPMIADVAIDIRNELETIVDMLACHVSQVFEWLPFLEGSGDRVPRDERQRRAWLRDWYTAYIRPRADRFRQALISAYGETRGNAVEFAEIYEVSAYASAANEETLRRLFM